MQPVIFKNIPLEIEKKVVLRRVGFSSKSSILTPAIEKLIDREMARLNIIVIPQVVHCDYHIDQADDTHIILKGTDLSFTGASLTKHLNHCHKISLFACTIGRKVEDETEDCFLKDEKTRGILLDGIGSVAVEALAEKINQLIIQKAYREQCATTRRFSPGYQDWPLFDQDIIFQLINPSRIGIALTDNYIMKPEKSITAVVGWKK